MKLDELKKRLSKPINETDLTFIYDWLMTNSSTPKRPTVLAELFKNADPVMLMTFTRAQFKLESSFAKDFLIGLLEYSSGKSKTAFLNFAIEILEGKPDLKSYSKLANYLIHNQQQTQLIPNAISWLEIHGTCTESAVLLGSLLPTNPVLFSTAESWLHTNKSDWYSPVLLSQLLEVHTSLESIRLAFEFLSKSTGEDYEVTLLVSPLLKKPPSVRAELIYWISENLEHPLAAEFLFEGVQADVDEFAALALEWMLKNNVDSNLSEACKSWMSNHPRHTTKLALDKFFEQKNIDD